MFSVCEEMYSIIHFFTIFISIIPKQIVALIALGVCIISVIFLGKQVNVFSSTTEAELEASDTH